MRSKSGLQKITPHDYVHQLSLRHPITPHVYRSILYAFHRFITMHSRRGCISERVIRKWLKDRASEWPFHLVAQRARVVDRYLDWAVQKGALTENPLAKLRIEYGQRTTAPVVRALLSANPKVELQALRPSPRFTSFLGPLMREHLALKRAMGHRYNWHERGMLRLDRFLQQRPDLAQQPIKNVIYEWMRAKSSAEHVLQCQKIGRVLSKALARIDPNIKEVPWDRRIQQEAYRHQRKPYILSESEVCRLFQAALNLPSPRSPLRPLSAYTMLVLAYCSGLRLGEIVRLNIGDFDPPSRTIEIRETKFFKTRRLPLSTSATEALISYLRVRKESGAPTEPSAGLFWHWHNRGPGRYSYVMIEHLLIKVFRNAGLKPKTGRTGPRIHDLRHAFVVHRMLAWYRQGINPQAHLPYLATYLGHRDIHSTLVYITVTQELLQRAGERFRQLGAVALQGAVGGGQ